LLATSAKLRTQIIFHDGIQLPEFRKSKSSCLEHAFGTLLMVAMNQKVVNTVIKITAQLHLGCLELLK
jgi:hypothetical protein